MNRNNARRTRQGNNRSSGKNRKHGIYQHTRPTHSHRNYNNFHNRGHHIRRRQKVALLGLAGRILHIFHPIPEEKPPVLSLPLLLQLQRKVLVSAPTRTRMADDHCGHTIEIFVNLGGLVAALAWAPDLSSQNPSPGEFFDVEPKPEYAPLLPLWSRRKKSGIRSWSLEPVSEGRICSKCGTVRLFRSPTEDSRIKNRI